MKLKRFVAADTRSAMQQIKAVFSSELFAKQELQLFQADNDISKEQPRVGREYYV